MPRYDARVLSDPRGAWGPLRQEGDTHPEAGQARELSMERGEAVVTHGEVFLQGSTRQAPVSRERS